MKHITLIFILTFSCLGSVSLLAQNSYKTEQLFGLWSVQSIGGEDMPAEFDITISFQQDETMIMSASGEQQSGQWTMKEGTDIIHVEAPDGKEKWTILKLNQKELWLNDDKGNSKIILYRKNKVEIDEATESQEDVPTDKKILTHELIANWTVVSIGELQVEEEQVIFKIQENGIIELPVPDGEVIAAKWEWNATKTALLVKPQEGKDEVWDILFLDEEQLKIRDNYNSLIILKK